MSDFLINLAARHLGRAQAVQPRLPARFERTAGLGAVPLSPALDGVEVTSFITY